MLLLLNTLIDVVDIERSLVVDVGIVAIVIDVIERAIAKSAHRFGVLSTREHICQ
jgi:hypothetical protein